MLLLTKRRRIDSVSAVPRRTAVTYLNPMHTPSSRHPRWLDCEVTAGAAANLFTVAASCIAEAVTAHPPRKLVLYDGKIVARDGSFLTAPIPIASKASA